MARVVFRCDASPEIGSGHVARCMALAQAVRARGAEVELVSRALPRRVRELHVAATGAVVHELANARSAPAARDDRGPRLAHADWLPVSQAVDADQTAAVLRAHGSVEWLIVDHYALDSRWERALRPVARNLLVIDDLADREHACDALLDQNFFLDAESRYSARVEAGTELMLGPKFALLRDEFGDQRKRVPARDGRVRRIFVCFGGFDGCGQTLRALEAVAEAGLKDVGIDVVLGADHPERAAIARFCEAHSYRIHVDAAHIAELLSHADLAIGASGIMNWERAALCVPAIVASLAENQHVVARDLAADRACIYLGFAQDWRAETLTALVRALAGTPALVRALAARAGALTDGRGARRVAARLLPETIALRRAHADDCDAMHAWRNAEVTRRHSANPAPITLEQHRDWFRKMLNTPATALLVGERGASAVGVLRYDVEGARAVVSAYLVPGMHGQGLGSALLRAGTRWMREHYAHVNELRAHVGRHNAASLAAFASAGYTLNSLDYALKIRHD